MRDGSGAGAGAGGGVGAGWGGGVDERRRIMVAVVVIDELQCEGMPKLRASLSSTFLPQKTHLHKSSTQGGRMNFEGCLLYPPNIRPASIDPATESGLN